MKIQTIFSFARFFLPVKASSFEIIKTRITLASLSAKGEFSHDELLTKDNLVYNYLIGS